MASVIRRSEGGRNGWRIRFYLEKRRRELYLPGVSKKTAETIGRHCDELAGAKGANIAPGREAVAWANGTEGKIRDLLVSWELAEPINQKLSEDAGRYLGAYIDMYIDGRTDVAKNTKINFKQAKRLLVEFFGERHPLRSITAADGERWRRWMLAKPLSIATVSMHTKKAKTMFNEAVNDRLLPENPLAALKGGSESNPERLRFIDASTAKKVLNACPDSDWKVVFALARYAGMRCPSEVLGLKWTDIDWADGRLRIDAPKTGLRFCPLFPELRAVLADAMDAAPDGAIYCAGRFHGARINLRTQFGRILENAGVKPWPKLFQNLRASRRTELQEIFPSHVINAWLGQSSAVAEQHYLQVTDEHWGRAVKSGAPAGAPIANGAESLTDHHVVRKTKRMKAIDASQGLVMAGIVPPTGIE